MHKLNVLIAFLLLFDYKWLYVTGLTNETGISQVLNRRMKRFTCPSDGKWPDETDCGKFYNCHGGSSTGGWCGPGMSFDVDNQRCEMALAINCKDGDRPDWNAPDGWEGKSTTTTTKRTTSTRVPTTTNEVPVVQKSAEVVKDGDRCNFKGRMPDKDNCAKFYYCKDGELKKDVCEDNQLFDEETKRCREFRSVFCNERPVNDKGKDPCKYKPNGVYPNIENGCKEFYQCSSQRKVKSGDCPMGLKFNVQTLRCDWPNNVLVPCGLKVNSSEKIKISTGPFIVILSLLTIWW